MREMKVVKRIINYDEKIDVFLLSDGEFLIHAVKEHLFESRSKEHEHPMVINREPWVFFDTLFGYWVFKRQNNNKEQILVLREVSRMKLEVLGGGTSE